MENMHQGKCDVAEECKRTRSKLSIQLGIANPRGEDTKHCKNIEARSERWEGGRRTQRMDRMRFEILKCHEAVRTKRCVNEHLCLFIGCF